MHSRVQMKTIGISFMKLAFALIILPLFVTFLQLSGVARKSNLVFVQEEGWNTDGFLRGIPQQQEDQTEMNYIPSRRKTKEPYSGMYLYSERLDAFIQLVPRSLWFRFPTRHPWPPIYIVSMTLALPLSGTHNSLLPSSRDDKLNVVRFNTELQRWCLNDFLCSSRTDDTSGIIPTAGLWSATSSRSVNQNSSHASVRITTSFGHQGFRSNGARQQRSGNQNLQFILQYPATTLLLLLNVGLAIAYWHFRISPSHVSKIYSSIVHDHQLWRSFTGATAHFELLHLGFNMMALTTLGAELEHYDSVSFLLQNLAFIPLTTIVMMGLVYLQMRYTGNPSLAETSTVGYSGILFALMVQSSLEQQQTCPIPFMPDVCFSTHRFAGVSFNLGPLIQLAVAQVLLRRVSFVGHLAGVIVGFLWHWNLLPLSIFQPSFFWSLFYFLHLWKIQHVLPIKDTTNSVGSQADEEQQQQYDWQRPRRERQNSNHYRIVLVQRWMLLFSIFNIALFDWALCLQFLMPTIFYSACVQAHNLLVSSRVAHEEAHKHLLAKLSKGFILSCVLSIVMDSMAIAGWLVAPAFVSPVGFAFFPTCVAMGCRISLQLLALCISCAILHNTGNADEGLFSHLFGATVLRNGQILGGYLIMPTGNQQGSQVFEGQGVALGSAEPPSRRQNHTSNVAGKSRLVG